MANKETYASKCARTLETDAFDESTVEAEILDSIAAYDRVRNGDQLWHRCFGKEILPSVATQAGYVSASALKSVIIGGWKNEDVALPAHVVALRRYIESKTKR
jgi:hypothetical protein